ncbi:MAG: polyprenyl synthetase family protein [Anaerolineae bacterium]|nr:polyprenyl synthetase family protein [Anaerolineae bacterium]
MMQYRTLLGQELVAVTELMLSAINQLPAEIDSGIAKLIKSGGKKLRPALVILSSHLYDVSQQQTCYAAAAVEMLHTATLIHDDLIDNAELRRGQNTLNTRQSSAVTVLSGDMTFALAAKFAAFTRNPVLVHNFALTLETICKGELNQLLNGHNILPTKEAYYERIYEKTASLFSLCTKSGAILSGANSDEITRAGSIGYHIGLAFQIADDVLDFMGSEQQLGKPVGGDLLQGIITLPMLRYIDKNPDDPRLLTILENKANHQLIKQLIIDLRQSDAGDWAMAEAVRFIDMALVQLKTYSESPYRLAVEEIAEFAVKRRY